MDDSSTMESSLTGACSLHHAEPASLHAWPQRFVLAQPHACVHGNGAGSRGAVRNYVLDGRHWFVNVRKVVAEHDVQDRHVLAANR